MIAARCEGVYTLATPLADFHPGDVVSGCDVYGSGRCLYLKGARGTWIHDNHFANGRWGWYCISGSDGLIFENNDITGADLMSTGGGLNCLDGSNYSQNVYFARNRMGLTHGWDREIIAEHPHRVQFNY